MVMCQIEKLQSCIRTYLGGKIEPSGPVPPKPDGVSGRRAVGLNRNPVTVAFSMGSKVKIGSFFNQKFFTSLGRNFSKLVTAGTVGTLSVTGRWLG